MATIDASIPLQVQPVRLPNQLEQLAKVQQIQGAQQRNRLYDLQLQDAQRTAADRTAVADLYRNNVNPDGTINRTGLIGGAAQIGQGALIPGFQKQFNDQDAAARNADMAKLKAVGQHIELQGQLLGSATDQASYTQALQLAQQNGIDVSQLPQQFDPNFVAQARQRAMTAAQQIENEWKAKGYDLDVLRAAETGRHNRAAEATSAAQLGVSQGNLAVSQAREAREANAPKGQYDSTRGVIVDTRAGTTRPVIGADGQPLAPQAGKVTEFQGKSSLFGARAEEANNILNNLSAAGVNNRGVIRSASESVPLVGGALGALNNMAPGFLGGPSPQQQQVDQAQRDFVNAVLRQESGAAISQSEFDNARKQYFPQYGDSKEVIAQKASNRALAVRGLQSNAGPAAFHASAQPAAAVPSVTSDADYAALPSGTLFTDPTGQQRRKP